MPRHPTRNIVYAIAALTVIGVIPVALFYAPVLYYDDWASTVEWAERGYLRLVDPSSGRPFQLVSRLVLYELFGLNIHAFYGVLLALNVFAAAQIYLLGRRIAPSAEMAAWAAAAIFLIYPADFTRTWLTMSSIKLVLCLALLFANLTLTYVESGRRWTLVTGLGCLLLSLGAYEGHFGIAMAWCIWLLVAKRGTARRRGVILVGVALVASLFAVWRVVLAPRIGMGAQYVEAIETTPSVLVDRLLFGLRILVWSWNDPVTRALQLQSTIEAGLIIAGAVAGSWLVMALIERKRGQKGSEEHFTPGRWTALRRPVLAFFAGVALAAAGYLPMITIYRPNLGGIDTRVNLFATLGASVAIAALLWAGGLAFARTRPAANRLVIASALPLVLWGMGVQAWVQHDISQAWNEQKAIWSELFQICPKLQDNTRVYFVLPGYQDRGWLVNWQRLPLSVVWEASSALRVLYGNNSLGGDVVFPDLGLTSGAPEFTTQGIVDYFSKQTTPFSEAFFVSYDGMPRRLRVLEDPDLALQLGWDPQGYAPETRCLPGPAPDDELVD